LNGDPGVVIIEQFQQITKPRLNLWLPMIGGKHLFYRTPVKDPFTFSKENTDRRLKSSNAKARLNFQSVLKAK
jgi:hypothetical protein